MDESYGSLRMILNLSFRCDNLPLLGRAGGLHLPPVVLTPRMIGHLRIVCLIFITTWILWIKELCRFKSVVIKIYSGD